MTTATEGTQPQDGGQPQNDGGTPANPQTPAVDTNVKLDDKPAADPSASPQQVSADPAPGTPVTYEPTGDAALDVALAFVGKLGIGIDDPAMKATATGDFGLIKAKLATMGAAAQGWEQMVALAEQSHTRQQEANKAAAAKTAAAVHEVAGGEQQWNAIKAWAAANATADEKQQINAMFDSGPLAARAAAQMLRDLHAKATGTVVNPASATRSNAGTGAPVNTTGPLSTREYNAAVRELRQKLGSRMDTSPEYQALRQRLRG